MQSILRCFPEKKHDTFRWKLSLGNVCQHLHVYGDWLGELGVFSLLEEMHDPQQDPVVVWF